MCIRVSCLNWYALIFFSFLAVYHSNGHSKIRNQSYGQGKVWLFMTTCLTSVNQSTESIENSNHIKKHLSHSFESGMSF